MNDKANDWNFKSVNNWDIDPTSDWAFEKILNPAAAALLLNRKENDACNEMGTYSAEMWVEQRDEFSLVKAGQNYFIMTACGIVELLNDAKCPVTETVAMRLKWILDHQQAFNTVLEHTIKLAMLPQEKMQ